ncbi:MAG TPA: hypothetical protein VIZ30_01395 [Pseudomonadales bacterium]
MKTVGMVALWFGLAVMAPAFADPADEQQQAADAEKMRNDMNTQAAIVNAVDKMKARDEAQAAAQEHYTQAIDAAKAEHDGAVSKCDALTGDAKDACKESADDALKLAKSEAQKTLDAHTAVQP